MRALCRALSGGLLLSACAGVSTARDTAVVASGADLESANPLVTVHPMARQVQRHALFVTLTQLDSALEARPYFARRWEWSADGRTLRLALFAGLRWHDGASVTARDVVFTLDAARDPATGFPRASELSGIERVSAPDSISVEITFRRPPPSLPLILAELPIVPAHLLAQVPPAEFRRHAFAVNPVGNGPFRFVRREPGRRWIFERVPDFPAELGGAAGLDRLVIAVVDEPTTKFAGLVSGDLDIAGIAPTMAPLVERDPALRVLAYPVTFASALVFNATRAPFDDPRVRRAIDALIDRQRIIDVALAGFGIPAASAVAEGHPYHVSLARLSAAAADSLLDAAGWRQGADGVRSRGGKPLAFSLLTVASGDNAMEQLLQADLRAHGIAVTIQYAELGAFLTTARATPKRFDALYTGIPGDLALSHLAGMFDGRLAGGALDYAGYHTPALDSLFAVGRGATSDEQLGASWRAIQQRLAEEAPVAWIYHARGVQGVARRLEGVQMDLRGELATVRQWRLPAVPDE